MGQRLELQSLLEGLETGVSVYFQPPENLAMQYPAIRYQRDRAETEFANNVPYRYTKRYQVIFISQDPDSGVPDKIAALPMCTFERHYTANDLHHDVFNLYF